MFAKSDLLEFGKTVLLCSTVYSGVFEEFLAGGVARGTGRRMEEGRWNNLPILSLLNLPSILSLVENETRVVIALV